MASIAPFLWIALVAFILAVPGGIMLFGSGDGDGQWPPRRRFRPVRRMMGLLLLLLAIVTTLLAFTMYRYLQLFTDRPVALVELHQEAPQRFRATVMMSDVSGRDPGVRHYILHGDAWVIDARVLRWQLPAALAGVPSLYSLDRISGRYDDLEQERTATRSVHALHDSPLPDLFSLKRDFPRWLPFVDARYGSATWMPMFDKARYLVLFNDRGGLLARPADTRSAERLDELGMGSEYRPEAQIAPITAPDSTHAPAHSTSSFPR